MPCRSLHFPERSELRSCSCARTASKFPRRWGRYSWIVPLLLYFAILFFIAVATGPVGFLIVLVFGFLFGLPALLIGIPLHLIGLLPLIYFEDRFFARRGDRSQ